MDGLTRVWASSVLAATKVALLDISVIILWNCGFTSRMSPSYRDFCPLKAISANTPILCLTSGSDRLAAEDLQTCLGAGTLDFEQKQEVVEPYPLEMQVMWVIITCVHHRSAAKIPH